MATTRTLDEARGEATALLKRYQRTPEEGRTPVLRELAEVLVDAREHFARPDGTPDWKGRSYPYRVFVRDVYDDAKISKEEQSSLQAAVRYHVGSVLRERLDDGTLEEYGLQAKSPRERSADQRANKSALLNALTAREVHDGGLLSLSAAWTVLSRMDPATLDGLDKREREVADSTLRDLERLAKRLRGRLASSE